MAAILTSNASVIAAENFITSIYDNDSNLYMGVGQGYSEGDSYSDSTVVTLTGANSGTTYNTTNTTGNLDNMERWTDEYNPPVPMDTIRQIGTFLTNLIGIKKIKPSNIMLVVPRNDWAVGKTYNKLQIDAIAGKRAQDYYCLTKSEQGNNCVWICIDKTDSAGTVLYEPTLSYRDSTDHSHNVGYHYVTNNVVRCGDGYTWMFLYNITSTIINAGLLLDNWMPVPFAHHGLDNVIGLNDDKITSASGALISAGGTLTDTQITYGDCNANRTLGAYRVLVTCTLGDEGTAIPYNSIYRQVGLLMDPRSSATATEKPSVNEEGATGNLVTDNNAYTVTNTYSIYPQTIYGARLTGERYSATEVDLRYGSVEEMMGNPVQVIYLENKKPMMREESQSEKLEIILVF